MILCYSQDENHLRQILAGGCILSPLALVLNPSYNLAFWSRHSVFFRVFPSLLKLSNTELLLRTDCHL